MFTKLLSIFSIISNHNVFKCVYWNKLKNDYKYLFDVIENLCSLIHKKCDKLGIYLPNK